MKKKIIALSLFIALCSNYNRAQITIHTIGDSTMALQDESTTDKRGWGMMFQQFFNSGVIVNNRAKSGASSKSYYLESPYWATVKTQIKSGDYVLIQFAHNDEKNGGLDGDTVRKYTDPLADYRGTTAQGTFKTYLRAYVNETRALGATPIFATAMCRKYFSGSTITRAGRHDLGDSFGVPVTDHTYDYSYALNEVAIEMGVPCIDLTTLTKNLFESYGDASCTSLLFSSSDGTHPNAMGATLVARLCAQEMTKQNILAAYINTSSDVLINPSSCDFGSAYTGQSLTKELTISGFDLNPTSGAFTLSVSDGYLISTSKTVPFASSASLNYSNSNLDFARFYISVSQSSPGVKDGTLTVTNGTVTKLIPLTASFIHLSGGTEVKLLWALSANADYVLTGPANPVSESYSNMYVQRYAVPNTTTVWPASSGYTTTRTTQRDLIVGDAWPAGEIDEVSTRYMQFGIAASPSTDLNIDSIGLYICGAGGNGMRCRISYSTNNFTDHKVIQEFTSMVANTMYAVSAIPVVKLAYGETLLVRVYPWYSSAATGKTICLADVCIHGMATSVTGIENTSKSNIGCVVNGSSVILQNLPIDCFIEIYTLIGNRIYTSNHRNDESIRVDNLTKSNIYLCKAESKSGTWTTKFIIP
jgi:lysophospholipase L1-like esterase